MSVKEFEAKIQKRIFWVLVLVKDLWTWITTTSKGVNFAN
jgi:hypothetical protein